MWVKLRAQCLGLSGIGDIGPLMGSSCVAPKEVPESKHTVGTQ